jgi:hypothetical protein
MDRKTAIAAALAITMSLTSGVVALSANAGALGFGSSTPVAATQSVVASAAGSVQSATANAPLREGEHDDSARSVQLVADPSASTKGEQHG